MTASPVISAGTAGVRVRVRVIPRASRAELAGVRDGRLVVRVTAPPIEGAANDAVIDLLSHVFDVPRRAVSILSGDTGREKTIVVAGVTEVVARQRLGL
jgi:uncharacterized protein (TIGR00251 family)